MIGSKIFIVNNWLNKGGMMFAIHFTVGFLKEDFFVISFVIAGIGVELHIFKIIENENPPRN